MSLGERLRRARLARGMTQGELAGKTFSKSFVSQIERGRVNPSLSSLRVLAERLGTPLAELVSSASPAQIDVALDLAAARLAAADWTRARSHLETAARFLGSAGNDGTGRQPAATGADRRVARLRRLEGGLLAATGDLEAALANLESAALLAAEAGDPTEEAHARLWEGDVCQRAGRSLRAVRSWEAVALPLQGTTAAPPGAWHRLLRWLAWVRLARAYQALGDEAEARAAREQALCLGLPLSGWSPLARLFLAGAEEAAQAGREDTARAEAAVACLLAQVAEVLSGPRGEMGPGEAMSPATAADVNGDPAPPAPA